MQPWLHHPHHYLIEHVMSGSGARLELGLHLGMHFINGYITVLRDLLVLLEFLRSRVVDVENRQREFQLGSVYRGMKLSAGCLEPVIGSPTTVAQGKEDRSLGPRRLVLPSRSDYSSPPSSLSS